MLAGAGYCEVMEMTFPHPVRRSVTRHSHVVMLAAAIERQANTRTAKAVLVAAKSERYVDSSGDALDQRIHYFGSHFDDAIPPFGAFWATRRTQDATQPNYEPSVYQDGSMNNKAHELNGAQSWKQFITPGHGASRTT